MRYKGSELQYQIDQEEGEVVLENIYTPEQFRRQGAGKKLVQALQQKAYDLDLPVTGYLYPQDDSITREELVEFYENLGFEVNGYDFIRADGVDTGVSVKKMVAGVSDLSDGSDGSDNSDGSDLRVLLSEYSAEQTSDIVAILRPFVGYHLAQEDAEQKINNYLIFPRITHIAGRVGPSRRFSGGHYQLARKCRRRKSPPNAHAHKPYPAPTERQLTNSGGCFHSRQSPYQSV